MNFEEKMEKSRNAVVNSHLNPNRWYTETEEGNYWRNASQGTSNTALRIRNVPVQMEKEQLQHIFEPYGKVVDCSFSYSKHPGVVHKFGKVVFESYREAERAQKNLHNSGSYKFDIDFFSPNWNRIREDRATGANNYGHRDSLKTSTNQECNGISSQFKMINNERVFVDHEYVRGLAVSSNNIMSSNIKKNIPFLEPLLSCTLCGNVAFLRCSRCKLLYCSKDCQTRDFENHVDYCEAHAIKVPPCTREVNQNSPSEKTTPMKKESEPVRSNAPCAVVQKQGTIPEQKVEKKVPNREQEAKIPESPIRKPPISSIFTISSALSPNPIGKPIQSVPIASKPKIPIPNPLPVLPNIKKIFLEDISDYKFSMSIDVPIVVVEFETAKSIFVHLVGKDYGNVLSEITSSVNMKCHSQKAFAAVSDLSLNQVVGAKFEDDIWYRGVVEDILDNSKIRIRYLEFGNVSYLPISKIVPLPEKLEKFPRMAIHVALDCVDSPESGIEIKETLTKLTESDKLKMSVKNYNMKPFLVTIKINGVDIAHKFIERPATSSPLGVGGGKFIYDQVNDKQSNTVSPDKRSETEAALNKSVIPGNTPNAENTQKFSLADGQFSELEIGKTYQVTILNLNVDVPELLFCTVNSQEEVCKILENDAAINEHCNAADLNREMMMIEADVMCLAKHSDDNWYRAYILSTENETSRLFFVDWGDIATIKNSDILPMEKKFMDIKIQTIQCMVKGWNNDLSDEEVLLKAKEYMINERVEVIVAEANQDSYVLEIPSLESKLKTLGVII